MLPGQRAETLPPPCSIELGVERDETGIAKHDGKKGDYQAAPKKSNELQGPRARL